MKTRLWPGNGLSLCGVNTTGPKLRQTNRFNFVRLAASSILLLCAAAAFAQLPTATILGTVKDLSAAVVPNAIVTVQNTETGLTRTTTSGTVGAYRVPALPVGRYDVRVEAAGFAVQRTQLVELTVGQEAVLNFSLRLGAVNETVEVLANAEVINTTNSSLGNLIGETQIQDLPLNGRNWISLATLQPGVTQASNVHTRGLGGSYISSNGAGYRSNNYLLDGAPMTNAFGVNPNSIAGTTLGVDGIREFKVVTNMFGAEYGMTMGSQMVLSSKGGSNRFHGDVYDFLRNAAFDARNFFDALGSDGTSLAYRGRRLPPYQRNNFGGAFGGPIRKDKTFFWGVYEGLNEHLGTTNVIQTLPAACHTSDYVVGPACDLSIVPGTVVAPQMRPFLDLYPRPNLPGDQFTYPYIQVTKVHYGQMRVDHNFSSRDTFFTRYTINDANQLQPYGYPQLQSEWTSRDQFVTLSETHTFTSASVNTVAASYSRSKMVNVINQPTLAGPPYSLIAGRKMGHLGIGNTAGMGVISDLDHTQNVYTFGDDFFWQKGKHALKMGGLVTRNRIAINDPVIANGLLIAPVVGWFITGGPFIQVATVPAPGTSQLGDSSYGTYGAYFQDDFRANSRLTLNLGVRWEFWNVPRERYGHEAALRNPATDRTMTVGPIMAPRQKTNFGPRLGLAWDVFGDGKTSVRGGFGTYYDIGNIGEILFVLTTGAPWTNTITSAPFFPPPFNGPFTIPFTIPQGYVPGNAAGPSYNQGQPRMYQYNLSVERQLPGSLALRVGYVGSKGGNLYVAKEGNPIPPASAAACAAAGLSSPCWMPGPGVSRVNPNFATYWEVAAIGKSWYNSFQINLEKRFSRGLQFQSSYTYSKLLDYGQGMSGTEGGASAVVLSNPFNPAYNKGLSNSDLKHNFQFNAEYRFLAPKHDNVASKFLKGWWLGGILTMHSGMPITPTVLSSQSGQNLLPAQGGQNFDRPNFVTAANVGAITSPGCGPAGSYNPVARVYCDPLAQVYNPDTVITGKVNQWFNPHMFTLQPLGTLGNVPRGVMRGPNFRSLDLSINKDTALPFLGEGGKLQFRVEFFNILNRANFAAPSVSGAPAEDMPLFAGESGPFLSPTAGLPIEPPIHKTVNTSRQVQFALKLIF